MDYFRFEECWSLEHNKNIVLRLRLTKKLNRNLYQQLFFDKNVFESSKEMYRKNSLNKQPLIVYIYI